ncbi:putative mannitol dehydrogenase [Dendrobium catenatum]|uniref:cinnamyl-alcohol dehydrogenase n=1 Tax=Dendrobium catenatum TaxID=906689 RepID=A0A2I0WQR7_9ASPA|nr:putative mannitol dehydrogenase [Dendrobium catenatum]
MSTSISTSSPGTERKAFGWAARDADGGLSPFSFHVRHAFFRYLLFYFLGGCDRRTQFGMERGIVLWCLWANGEEDITLKILYCGICHTDLHIITNDWGNASYPVVPGHEITGIVTAVGQNVQKFKIGDKAGVGYMVGSCNDCGNCKEGYENYCPNVIPTSNGIQQNGKTTYGGFADILVVNEAFAVNLPENMPLDKTGPLLCAGVTVYTPMRRFGLNEPGKHLGVVGLGGLGHLAVKFGKALGLKVTVISTSSSKKKEAIERLGADSFLVSSDNDQMKAAMGTLDGIIDTVSAHHAITPLILLLKTYGKLVLVGGKIVAGSLIGGIRDTQEMVNFAAEHNIAADVEVVPMDYVNTAFERLAKGDVRYRFVVDVANSLT